MTDKSQRILIANDKLINHRNWLLDSGFSATLCATATQLADEINSGCQLVVTDSDTMDPKIELHLEHLCVPVVTVGTDCSRKALVALVRISLAHRGAQLEIRRLEREVEISNRARSEFLSNISHEVRTPLCAILGFSELMSERSITPSERELYLSIIHRNAKAVSTLFDDILDLTRVECGEIEAQPFEFSLSEVLGDLVTNAGKDAAKKGLALTVQRLDDHPDLIHADLPRLQQILLSLVGNAIKFTSHGSVIIRVVGRCNDNSLKFEIEDSGIGISQAQATELFQPFKQIDSSSTRQYGGVGLGLVLARKLARALGGDLELKWSVPGGGSCFALTLAIPAKSVNPITSSCETVMRGSSYDDLAVSHPISS
jgi:signal transduction histidine kinase